MYLLIRIKGILICLIVSFINQLEVVIIGEQSLIIMMASRMEKNIASLMLKRMEKGETGLILLPSSPKERGESIVIIYGRTIVYKQDFDMLDVFRCLGSASCSEIFA